MRASGSRLDDAASLLFGRIDEFIGLVLNRFGGLIFQVVGLAPLVCAHFAHDQEGDANSEREAKGPLGLKPPDQELDLAVVTTPEPKYPRAYAQSENERTYILWMGSHPSCYRANRRDDQSDGSQHEIRGGVRFEDLSRVHYDSRGKSDLSVERSAAR